MLPVTRNDSVWPASFGGPALIAVAQGFTVTGPASSALLGFAPAVKLGASLMPVTVIVKVWGAEVSTPPLAVPPSSCSVSVIVATPDALAAGV